MLALLQQDMTLDMTCAQFDFEAVKQALATQYGVARGRSHHLYLI